MPLPILCPVCGSKTMAPETALGKRAKCPKCSATLLIPVAILATLIEAPQPKPVRPPTPPVAFTPVPLPPPPIPLPEPVDVEVVEYEAAPPPPAQKLARPVAKRAPEPTAALPVEEKDTDIFSNPPPAAAEAPMPSGSNPFAGFVVPGSVAEQMNPKAERKRRDEDGEDDDKPRRKRR